MRNVKAVWDFIAGESRLAPLGVVIAIVAAILALRYVPGDGALAGFALVGCIAAGLVAGVFEKV